MSIGGRRIRAGYRPYGCSGWLALLLACGPNSPESSTTGSASEATSQDDPGAATTTATTTATATLSITSSGTGTTVASGTTSDTTETIPDLPVEPTWVPIACETDEFEANDVAMLAAPVDVPCSPFGDGMWSCDAFFTACHGLGDVDWYALPVTPEPGNSSVFQLILWILPPLGVCNCSEDPVPSGPELATTIEIYDALTMALLGEVSGTDPYLWLYFSDPFSRALLVRVIGPADVSWTYDMWINRQDSAWEDSCEC